MPSEAGSADYECLHYWRLYRNALYTWCGNLHHGKYQVTFWNLSEWEVSTDQWTWPGGSRSNWIYILEIAGQVLSKQWADGIIQISHERLGINSGVLLVNWINFSWTRHLSNITPLVCLSLIVQFIKFRLDSREMCPTSLRRETCYKNLLQTVNSNWCHFNLKIFVGRLNDNIGVAGCIWLALLD